MGSLLAGVTAPDGFLRAADYRHGIWPGEVDLQGFTFAVLRIDSGTEVMCLAVRMKNKIVRMKVAVRVIGAVVGAFALMAGCFYLVSERPTVVSVHEGPSFAFKGSGRLAIFAVYAPPDGSRIAFPDRDDSKVVWEIRAKDGYFNGNFVENVRLTYGKVPDGYTQIVPPPSQSPPSLPVGAVYSFWAETTDAPIASGDFYMGKTGPVQTYIPDLCLTLQNGHEVRVRCGVEGDRTYHEPTNLDEVVLKYRIKDTSEAEKFRDSQPCEPTQTNKEQSKSGKAPCGS